MSITDIVKAWKDEDHRAQLVSQGIQIPESPVGLIELEETDFSLVHGGTSYVVAWCGGANDTTCGCPGG